MELSNQDKFDLLKSVQIFKLSSPLVIEEVAARMTTREFKAGDTVFEKGAQVDHMYVVASGRLKVHDGSRFLFELDQYELFGEMALLDSAPRTASVTAISDVNLLRLNSKDFQQLLEKHPELMRLVIQELARRLGERYRDLDELQQQLEQVILPLGIALSTERDVNRLLERILTEAKGLCNADAGTIYLRTGDDHLKFSIMFTDSLGIARGGSSHEPITLRPLALFDPVSGEPNYKNVATYVALRGQAVNIPDIYHAETFDFSGAMEFDRITGYHSKSNLTIPLKDHEGKVIGVMQLFNAQDPETGQVVPFNELQRLIAESLTSQAAVALNTQMLLKRQQELLKFEHDLQVGRQIQADFLPDHIPQPPGWEIASYFQPAREVAGDFYDVFTSSSGKITVVVADVCDKGVGAALFMALSRSLIRAFSWLNHAIDVLGNYRQVTGDELNLICLTNDYIMDNHMSMNMFVTLFYGILDPQEHTLTYINAGHNPPALVSAAGEIKARLAPTGPAVGIMEHASFTEVVIGFEPGDLLLAFTDGATDARNESGAFFSEKRLLGLLDAPYPSADSALERIRGEITEHVGDTAPFDDITLMVLRRK